MNADEYIKKYGQVAYDFLSEEDKKRLEIQGQTRNESSNSEQFRQRGSYFTNEVLQNAVSSNTQSSAPESRSYRTNSQSWANRSRSTFVLAEEEKILKSYHASHIKFPSCEGYLTVTNKRLIFRGDGGGDSFVMDEVKIDSVSGFSSFCGTRFIMPLLILGTIFLLYGLSGLSELRNRYGGGPSTMTLFAIVAGVALLFFSHRAVFMLKVFSAQAHGGAIEIGEGLSSAGPLSVLTGSSAVYSLIGRPTDETRTMLNELGAIVRDLQTLDEETVFAKWGK
jgi:hypothetical protein